ncbi:DHHW family protein [Alloiococcus sp. CFN-8]|uniref:DHHW family protein n=1 Tax=Alloiococcus sp. CFN-8 TaxID=3416081 RepID=UPI003CF26255
MKNKIITIVFIIVLGALSIMNVFTPKRGYSEGENRFLAQKPEFTLEAILNNTFSKEYEEYITDQFTLRDMWVSVKNKAEIYLGKKDNGRVYFGKDGYLIEKHSEEGVNQELIKKNIAFIKEFIEGIKDDVPLENINMIIAPTIDGVQKDKLPAYAEVFNQEELLNVLEESFSNINYIDVKETLEENRQEYIYYRTDHHWTTYGAFLAYKEWCEDKGIAVDIEDYSIEQVTDKFLGSTYAQANILWGDPDTIEIYEPREKVDLNLEFNLGEKTTDTLYDYSKLEGRDKYGMFLWGNDPIVKIKSSNENGKKVIVIKDSYGNCFIPFMAKDYEEIHVIDLRYYNGDVKEYIKDNGIPEVLFLYNTISFAQDTNIIKLK